MFDEPEYEGDLIFDFAFDLIERRRHEASCVGIAFVNDASGELRVFASAVALPRPDGHIISVAEIEALDPPPSRLAMTRLATESVLVAHREAEKALRRLGE